MDLLFFEEYTKLKQMVLQHEELLKKMTTSGIVDQKEEVSDEVKAEIQSIKN